MRLFGSRRANPIRVTLNMRAFVDGRMARLSLDARASEGDRLKDLLKQLGREGTIESSLIRYILKGNPGVTVLQNGHRLSMPKGARARLAEGELSILTTMAGG
jgi:hypothetical protein